MDPLEEHLGLVKLRCDEQEVVDQPQQTPSSVKTKTHVPLALGSTWPGHPEPPQRGEPTTRLLTEPAFSKGQKSLQTSAKRT